MKKTIKKTISTFLIFGFLLNVLLPTKASGMTGPWWSGSQGSDSTGVASSPTGESCLTDNREHQEQAGEPVSIHNGDFIYQHQDLLIPSRAMPAEITRTYKSQSRYNNRFGYGWDISCNKRIIPLCNGDLFYLNGELNRYRFVYIDGTNYVSPKGIYDTMVQNSDGTYTLTEKHGTAYEFNQNGVLTEISDRNNNSLYFTYEASGKLPIIGKSFFSNDPNPKVIAYDYKLIKITDTVGREIILNYNSNGRLETIVDFSGRTCTYAYDPSDNGDLISFTTPATEEYPAGLATTYSYTDHNLETITDAKGQTYLTNYYDASDRIYQQDYGSGTFTFSYDTVNNRTTVTDPKGFVTEWSYDSYGSPISRTEYTAGLRPTDPASYAIDYQHNNNLERTSITYPAGNGITYTYDEGNPDLQARGNLLEIRRKPDMTLPDDDLVDLVTSFAYETSFNFIKTITDPRGNVTTYNYDANGNLLKITYPTVGAVTPETNFTYNSYGQVETVTDPNGNITKYEYYPDTGYLKKVTAAFGTPDQAETQFSYDAVGNGTSITDPRGNATGFTYNELNQLTQTVSPAPFNYITNYFYDENGNLKQVDRQTDDIANPWQTTTYTYTILDKLDSFTDDLDNATHFDYDLNENRSSITDAEGNITEYVYDERDLLWKVVQTNNGQQYITEYSYDANGNLKGIKDASGNKTSYQYDGFGRLKLTTYEDATTESYAYDAAGNLKTKTDQKGQTVQYDYDELNRLTLKTYPNSATVDYIYDVGSRLTDIIDISGTIQYDYDEVNRVKQVTYPDSIQVAYQYDANGNRTRLTYPDSSYITYWYDELNRLTDVKDSASQVIAHYTYDALSRREKLDLLNGTQAAYQYDAINRLLNLTNQTMVPTTIANFDYTYDNVGNRETMTVDDTDTHSYTYDDIYQLTNVTYPGTSSTTYNYDEAGNRLSVVNGDTTTYAPDGMNQYDSVEGVDYSYDDNGNLTSDGTNTYTYDCENRLIHATVIASGSEAIYSYDPFGRRIQKNVDGTVTKFIYDGDQVIVETNGAGETQGKYIYGPGIDEPILMERGGETYYYHFDGLGSVIALTDDVGNLTESYEYDIFGEVTGSFSSVGNPYYFTGRRYDSETGLYYYRARMYSPTLGRFLQTDPIGYWGGINLYRYCHNDPINYYDPFGLCDDAKKDPWWEPFEDWFPEYGNYYGPKNTDPTYKKKPIDQLDDYCMQHDKNLETMPREKADKKLLDDVRGLPRNPDDWVPKAPDKKEAERARRDLERAFGAQEGFRNAKKAAKKAKDKVKKAVEDAIDFME